MVGWSSYCFYGICLVTQFGPRSATAIIFAGQNLASLISAACSAVFPWLPQSEPDVTLAMPHRPLPHSKASLAVDVAFQALRASNHSVTLLTPSSLRSLAWASRKSESSPWTSLPLTHLSDTLPHAILPTRLTSATSIVLLIDVREAKGPRPTLALGAWREFLHPKQRLLLALASRRLVTDPEIAALIQPRAIMLIHAWDPGFLVHVCPDRIASELLGLAVHQATRCPAALDTGPWEDTIVQRATELDLGIRLPTDLIIEWRWLGSSDQQDADELVWLAEVVTSRLGVPPAHSRITVCQGQE